MVDFDLDLDGRFLSGIIINNDTKWFPPRNNDLPSWYRYCAVSLFMMIPNKNEYGIRRSITSSTTTTSSDDSCQEPSDHSTMAWASYMFLAASTASFSFSQLPNK
jgi:membrane-associated phospholipid phosphatase